MPIIRAKIATSFIMAKRLTGSFILAALSAQCVPRCRIPKYFGMHSGQIPQDTTARPRLGFLSITLLHQAQICINSPNFCQSRYIRHWWQSPTSQIIGLNGHANPSLFPVTLNSPSRLGHTICSPSTMSGLGHSYCKEFRAML